jgi:sugar phosphate isomerase/epimerase
VNVVLVAFFAKGDLRGDKEGTEVVIERLKRVAPKAEKAGVILGVESWLSAEQHMDILDRVGSPAVQVYYDVGNSHKAGYDIFKEIRFLGKHICEFHAKDNDDLYGKGSMNFPEVRRAMDDIGYRGWIQIEGTKFPLGAEESVRYDLEYLRGVFPPEV